MLTTVASEFLWGIALFAIGLFSARELFRLSRRNPASIIVKEGLIGDFICVGEVMLLVVGGMALLRGLMTIF